MQILHSEDEMINFGVQIAQLLTAQKINTLELIGDVGTGKTTITRGIAKGLGVQEAVTSPSFTISKQYATEDPIFKFLIHYDFYRLGDPGIMQEDLAENLKDPDALTIIEWGASIANLLPENHAKITIQLNDDGTRTVETENL